MKVSLLTLASVSFISIFQEASAWTLGPRFYGLDLYSPLTSMDKAWTRLSPRYEITNSDEKFQVSIDVPGVPPENIQVDFNEKESMLTIRGHRSEASKSDSSRSYTSQFAQSFSVDPTVDVTQFAANLNHGVLVISAPKDLKKLEAHVRNIPVMAGAATTSDKNLKAAMDTESTNDVDAKSSEKIPVKTHANEERKDAVLEHNA
ncbi:hypothetical protein ACA910_017838 [Epithemia clementina (nom. ined.)]